MADHRAEDPPPPPPRKRQRASEAEGAPTDAVADVAEAASTPDAVVHDLDADPPAPRRPRRVTTPSPTGSDPTPISEAPRHRANENDQRLRADKPPHWG